MTEPVAYRVKDFADGWFFYDHQTQLAEATRAGLDGALVQPLHLQPGEEFLEFKEALSDLRSLRQENRDLNGGGPGWSERWAAAWAKADDLFANEDEAAYDRHMESFYG